METIYSNYLLEFTQYNLMQQILKGLNLKIIKL